MNRGQDAKLIYILLIAAAVQAATPDTSSLVSVNGLWLLLPEIARPEESIDDDQVPDEVCEPAARVIDTIASHIDQLKRDFHVGWKLVEIVEPSIDPSFPSRTPDPARLGFVISPPFLCRFDC